MSEFEQATTQVDWDAVRAHLAARDCYGTEATNLYLIIQSIDQEGYTPAYRQALLRLVGRLTMAQHEQ